MKLPNLFRRSKKRAASATSAAANGGGFGSPPPSPPRHSHQVHEAIPPPPPDARPPPPLPAMAPPSSKPAPQSSPPREKSKKSKPSKKHRKSEKKSSHHKHHHRHSRKSERKHSDDADASEHDPDFAEPSVPIAVGTRRISSTGQHRGTGEDAGAAAADLANLSLDPGNGGAGKARPSSIGAVGSRRTSALNRRTSSKNVKLLDDDDARGAASVAGNFMQNIHASPLQTTVHYEAPVYPKSEEDADFVSIALQRNFVFANALSDDDANRKREMGQIVDAFESYCVKEEGVNILSAGEVGDYFYILKEGCVEYKNVPPNDPNGEKVVVGKAKRPGQSFGELCLLYDCPPPADCVSGPPGGGAAPCRDGSSCRLWRLHKLTFRQIMALRTMRRDEKLRDAIRKIEEFRGLDDEFVNRIANALDVRTVKKGEAVYRSGEAATEFYVVGSEGRVAIAPDGGKGTTLGGGEAFGTEALAGNAPRTETAVAEKRTTLMVMSREHLDRTIGSLEDAIQLSNDRRLLKSIPLFRDSDFEEFEYELLAALIERVVYRGGKIVCEEEDKIEEPALVVVREGILDQFSDRYPEREKVLKDGDTFGEQSLTPDKNMKFGGAKGGDKYYEETIEVVSDACVCGRLTLSNIDSVILDLHRLGCKRRGSGRKRGDKLRSSGKEEEPVPMALDDLEFHQLFGAGTFGRVWIVSRPGGRTPYALKIQSKRELLDQRQASSAKREREVMAKLDHPFVCRLINTFQDDPCIYMLLSLIQGGELLNLIQGGEMHGGLPEIATKFYAAGMLEGLTYMHRRHIVYRDLKPENVLLDSDGYPVIVDFGFSKVVTDKTYTFCGTPLYLAPEIVLSRGHDRAVDYWSLGCLIYEMLFGSTPFYERGIDQKGLFKNIVRGRWRLPDGGSKLSRGATDLIYGMLQKRPTERLGCLAGGYRDVKMSPFFREVNFAKLVKKQIKAPWVPHIEDALDISHFENFDAGEGGIADFARGKRPLTADEQIVFQDF